jgi:hypothetical protein
VEGGMKFNTGFLFGLIIALYVFVILLLIDNTNVSKRIDRINQRNFELKQRIERLEHYCFTQKGKSSINTYNYSGR